MLKNDYAIGVFDSGLGGLTVVRELIRQLPQEDIVYFGDTARVPYGTKSADAIIQFSKENVQFLLKHKVKVIVVACNSSSSFSIPILRKRFSLPIIGVIKPGAVKAAQTTRNKKIGVIATSATIQSKKYYKTIKALNPRMTVVSQPCPLFVPLVEEGWMGPSIISGIAKKYLQFVKSKGVDTLILGCTHYPLLKPAIMKIMGKSVILIDSAREVAAETKRILEQHGLCRKTRRQGRCRIFVSDKPQHFKELARRFLGYRIKQIRKV